MKKTGVLFPGNTVEEQKVNFAVDRRLQEITFRTVEDKQLTPGMTALTMFKLFEEIVNLTSWKDASELKENFKRVCNRLIDRDRLNFVVRNCSERMLKIFKQKCYDLKIELKEVQGLTTIQSLRHLNLKKVSSVQDDFDVEMSDPFKSTSGTDFDLAAETVLPFSRRSTMMPSTTRGTRSSGAFGDVDLKRAKLKTELVSLIREIIEEIEMSKDDVTAQAREHISDNDLILTYHTSGTLTSFFVEAYKESANFEVIVCETAPKFTGH